MVQQLKHMKSTLMNCVQGQLGDLSSVDAKELGEAIDMIKDLSEAIYYCTVTEAMEGTEEDTEYGKSYYTTPWYDDPYRGRDLDKYRGRMYYGQGGRRTGMGTPNDGNADREHSIEIRDHREGRSPITRKMYMEHKELRHGKEAQMHELEKYVHELTGDIMEMLEDATPEEKQLLKTKISTLATKIV